MAKRLIWVAAISTAFFALPTFTHAQREIKADKITSGRTADEKVHEYALPANKWLVTSLWITPNQEVLIHHFISNERVTVKLGALNDSRLQRASAILPLYTSRNYSFAFN